ncbi:hypothetical protein ACQ4PT_015190 [Festuca glaucescens]
MGNCFTKTEYTIIQPSPPSGRQPSANAKHGKPPPKSPEQAAPTPKPMPWSKPACGVAVWPVPMLDVHSLYILERELRSGQFGTTYLCTERATGARYACRSVSKQKLLLRPADVEGVRREVTVLQHLRAQPNIAEFRVAFEDADSVHLVMELCSGGELLDRVAARGSYSERQAAATCRDVLTVVHVCHSMGVMHRDLRPENFLLASSAEDAPLKAVHFGLSVFIEQGQHYAALFRLASVSMSSA